MIGRARKLARLVCAGFALTAFPVATAAATTCKPADGQRPSQWLTGWYPATARQQMAAAQATTTETWWHVGTAPVLLVQPSEDPIAPAGNAEALRRDIGDRLSLVQLSQRQPRDPAGTAQGGCCAAFRLFRRPV